MVGQLDTSALQNIKSLRDINVQRAAENNQIAGAQIENASKQNLYRTQVLTGAIASGDQNMYDQARAQLQGAGIDVSDLAPDIATGAAQVNAMRQSLYSSNPLSALLGLGLKAEGNTLQAGQLTGNMQTGQELVPISGAIQDRLGSMVPGMGVAPGVAPLPGAPAQAPAPAPAAPIGPGTPIDQGNPFPPGFENGNPNQPADPSLPGAPMTQQQINDALPPNLQNRMSDGSAAPAAQAPAQGGIDANGSTADHFNPPAQVAGETLQAHQQRIENAFNQWKENPAVKGHQSEATSGGGKTGEDLAEAEKTVAIMQANLPHVLQRFQIMRDASKNASSGFGVADDGEGWKQHLQNSGVGSSEVSQANNVLEQAAAQGILPEIGPALAQAGIKGNKFLETLSNSASGLKMSAPADVKIKLIDQLQNTYINNLRATAQRLRASGKPAPTDEEIDQAVNNLPAAPDNGVPASPMEPKYKQGDMKDGTDGRYMFVGGDWRNKESWKKVSQ